MGVVCPNNSLLTHPPCQLYSRVHQLPWFIILGGRDWEVYSELWNRKTTLKQYLRCIWCCYKANSSTSNWVCFHNSCLSCIHCTLIYLLLVCVSVCLSVNISNKRQNGWTDWTQIYVWDLTWTHERFKITHERFSINHERCIIIF